MATLLADGPAPSTAQPGASLNRSHPFTCVTCAIAFRSSKMQRDHMRSDWHRYNLKRRVASLPPLSSEIFAEKVLTAQATSSAAAAKAAFKETCGACQKTYYSENAYQNHLGSQRHRQRAAALEMTHGIGLDTPSIMSSTLSLGEPIGAGPAPEHIDDEEVEKEFAEVVSSMKDTKLEDLTSPASRRPARPQPSEPDSVPESPASPTETTATDATHTSTAMPLSRCLFCNYDSPTFKLSILHMSRHHALFIPEQDYLVDMEGLVRYLQAKVSENYECLFCHKLKGSASGIQTHMRDKGHTMIAFESEEEMVEIGQFYDFRSTYSDDEEEVSDSEDSADEARPSAATKLGAKRDTNQSTEEDEGWETDSDESVDSDEIGSVPLDKDSTYRQNALARYRKEPRGVHASEGILPGVHPRNVAYSDGHELHLPSGRTAGHRKLARYYRQNLHNYPTPEERLVQQRLLADAAASGDSATGPVLTAKARQLARRPVSELGLVGVTDAKRRQVTAIANKQQTIGQRHEKQYRWNVEKRANNQRYFRDDNFGIRI